MLSCQTSAPGSERVMQYAGTGKKMHEAIFFLLQNLALQLGLGQGCQPERHSRRRRGGRGGGRPPIRFETSKNVENLGK